MDMIYVHICEPIVFKLFYFFGCVWVNDFLKIIPLETGIPFFLQVMSESVVHSSILLPKDLLHCLWRVEKLDGRY